jgi:ankyrin repeat protein
MTLNKLQRNLSKGCILLLLSSMIQCTANQCNSDGNSDKRPDITSAMLEASKGSEDLYGFLVDLKAGKKRDINKPAIFTGKTILYDAIDIQNEDIVKLLLQEGANINHTDSVGNTPLIHAIEHSNCKIEIVKLLLAKPGINLEVKAKITKATALFIAIDQERPDIVQALLQAGANVNATARDFQHTPLIYAINRSDCSLEIVEILLAQPSISLEEREDLLNQTALFKAIDKAHVDVVKALIRTHANTTTPIGGRSPRQYAIYERDKAGATTFKGKKLQEIVDLLRV